MEPLALITHIVTASSVVALSVILSNRIIALYTSINGRFPKLFLGTINLINVAVFGALFIVVPNAVANFIVYAADKSVYLQTHTGSSFFYVCSFIVASILLKLFSSKKVKNV